MFEWLQRSLEKIGSPELDWVQVEVTTHCEASCIYCPHTLFRSQWKGKHMSVGLFCQLVPYLRYTELVYLQGWGEPLLNNDIFEMIGICKRRGKRVGFSTNGMLLTEDTLRQLVDLRLDILGVSLAGTTAATHNRIRKGTDFDEVISNLEHLIEIKASKRSEVPNVHLAFLMLKSNFAELKEIVRLAKRTGAAQIVASNLTLILDPALSDEAIFNDEQRMEAYCNSLEQTRESASREDLVFEYHGPRAVTHSVRCRENVHRACVVCVDGDVVPCVYTDPVLGEASRGPHETFSHHFFRGQDLPLKPLSFGKIGDENLTRIWEKRCYQRLRCLFAGGTEDDPEQTLLQLPQACLTCYKRLGV